MGKNKKKQVHPKKKSFVVGENESLDQCIERMKREGYTPIRRMEQPIFRESETGPVCIGKHCILEGNWVDVKDER